jgi:hypothetical protein
MVVHPYGLNLVAQLLGTVAPRATLPPEESPSHGMRSVQAMPKLDQVSTDIR